MVIIVLIGCKLSFSTLGVLIRWSVLKVSTFVSLGFGPVSVIVYVSVTITSRAWGQKPRNKPEAFAR